MNKKEQNTPARLTALGAWALAFGCSVGRGAFMMPGSTFLPAAGPLGTVLGLGLGAVVMLLLAMNYHFLMNRSPEKGGTYAYSRSSFGYDHGYLTAWFLGLTYTAIIWANATALPWMVRTLFGNVLQFGFHYVVAGYHVYLGEVLLSVLALVLAALLCMRRTLAVRTQIVMSLALIAGVVLCFAAALARGSVGQGLQPAFAPERSPFSGTLIVFGLAPWAYVGFESICHSAEEAQFPLKKSFKIMAAALGTGALTYILLALLSAGALPEGCASWQAYAANPGSWEGIQAQPAFCAAQSALGGAGAAILGVAALCAIFTGIIGGFFALSRLICALSEDRLLPGWFGKLDDNQVPRNAIVFLLVVSAVFPFLGMTAISWIVDVTAVGATIAYAIVSAAAWKTAGREKEGRYKLTGLLGLLFSVLLALELVVPNLTAVKTLSTQSYLILAAWGVLGFLVLRVLIAEDVEKRLGRSTFALIILLAVTIFTSSVWMLQAAKLTVNQSMDPIQQHYLEELEQEGDQEAAAAANETIEAAEKRVDGTMTRNLFLQMGMVVIALTVTMDLFAFAQNRGCRMEIEKALSEEASRARSSFLSNMSHEIRTPMNAIIGLDNIALRNPNVPPETREQLEKIGNSANHLLELINDMLDMGLIESGNMTLREGEFSTREFLDQLNSNLNEQCAAKGLHYECSIVGMLEDYYFGDSGKLRRALTNVLNNAVKFTDAPGRVLFSVEQRQESEDSFLLRFTVKDTGVGIDEGFLPKIFEPFSQEDMTKTSRFGGSGLGLAIADRFVKMMRGTIEVQSEKGVGSVFTLTIPMQRSEHCFQPESGAQLPSRLTAAVVDSDSVACERARMVLNAIGVEADGFQDPWEAIERIRQAHQLGRAYSLVITDFKLTNMNGLELTRMIRSFDDNQTGIIMLTGYNWDIIAEEAEQGGVDSIGAKPLFPDSLQKEIQTVLAKKAGREVPQDEEQAQVVLAGHRILIAEDIQQNAEILRDLLELEDMSSEHAANGKIATEMFAASAPGYYDAILMDVRMPVMDGLTATETIRAMEHPDAKTIPIIAMTATVFDEDVRLSLDAGMNAHLTKPVELELLYETLKKYFSQREKNQ